MLVGKSGGSVPPSESGARSHEQLCRMASCPFYCLADSAYGWSTQLDHLAIPLAVCGRCILLAGLLTKPIKRTNGFRFIGAALTYLICLVGSVVIIVNTFSALTAIGTPR